MLLLDARGARQIPKYSLGLHFLIRIYIALLLLVFPVSKFLGAFLLGLEMSTYMRAYPTWIEYFLKVDEPAAFPEMSIFFVPNRVVAQ